jgi:hypothetical protein
VEAQRIAKIAAKQEANTLEPRTPSQKSGAFASSYAQMPREHVRTAPDDDGLMVLRTSRTGCRLDLSGAIVADWRDGDIW